MTLRVTHFPLRKLDRDAPVNHFIAPEVQHPDWPQAYKWNLVYRFYDADLNPLYIGMTHGGLTRWDSHRKRSEWWPLAEYVAVSYYATYADAQVAEKAAIRHEQPRCNKQFMRRPAIATLRLHESAEDAAALLFRDAAPEFIRELNELLAQPERFPQPEPPPPARFADEQARNP